MGLETTHVVPSTHNNRNYSEKGGIIGFAMATAAFGVDSIWIAASSYSVVPPEHVLAIPPILLTGMITGMMTPVLYRRALQGAYEADDVARTSEASLSKNQEHTGVTIKNAPHLLLMMVPNIFNPGKALNNLKHPIGEVLHTKHIQYPLEEKSGIYIVEHELFGRLVTVDIVRKDRFPKPWVLRLKQLFSRDFYYGHAQYFPEAFRLIDRSFVDGDQSFDIDAHIKKVLESPPS